MKITDEMVKKAHAAYWRSDVPSNEPMRVMRGALEAALEGYEVAPFELSEAEDRTFSRLARSGSPYAFREGDAGVILGAIDRAQRTLVAKQAEALSDELRADANWVEINVKGTAGKVAAELLRRCPAPAPKSRTPEELASDVMPYLTLTGYAAESLQELVRLATEKQK